MADRCSRRLSAVITLCAVAPSIAQQNEIDDLLIAEFGTADYAGRPSGGDAFGAGPATGTWPDPKVVLGFLRQRFGRCRERILDTA